MTFLQLGVEAAAPESELDTARAPLRALVDDDNGQPLGELIVWVTHGRLSELEYAWVTDEPPHSLPHPRQVAVEDR
jgi:hypothetical protein